MLGQLWLAICLAGALTAAAASSPSGPLGYVYWRNATKVSGSARSKRRPAGAPALRGKLN